MRGFMALQLFFWLSVDVAGGWEHSTPSAPVSFCLLGAAECRGGIFMWAFISEESKHVSLFSSVEHEENIIVKVWMAEKRGVFLSFA